MTAIPPATDIPMIDPVPRLLLLLLGGALGGALDETAEELEVVSVTVGGRPLGPVESGTAVFGAEVWVGGEEVCREVVEAEDWVAELEEEVLELELVDWEVDWVEVESAVWVEVGGEDWEGVVVEGSPSNWALPPTAKSSATSHDARTFIAALVVKDSPQVQQWLCHARLARPPRPPHPPPPTHRRRPPRPPTLGPAAQGCSPHTPSSRCSPLYSPRLRCSSRHRISLQYHL